MTRDHGRMHAKYPGRKVKTQAFLLRNEAKHLSAKEKEEERELPGSEDTRIYKYLTICMNA